MPKKLLKKSKNASKMVKKASNTTAKKAATKNNTSKSRSISSVNLKGKMQSKSATKLTKITKNIKAISKKIDKKAPAVKNKIISKSTAKGSTNKPVQLPKLSTANAVVPKKRGRPPKNSIDGSLGVKKNTQDLSSDLPKRRGRPPKIKPEGDITDAAAQDLLLGPKKRGRKSKAELEAIAQGLDPRTVSVANNANAANGYAGGVIPLGQPIKRKRGRPRKNEQYGVGGAVLNSELMARGIRRFGVPIGGTDIPVARYSWSAETGEHLSVKTANFSSADSGVEVFTLDNDEFAKGDKVVYPAHGLGVVQAIQSRLVGGAQQKFYLIQIIETGMKIMVPVSQSKTVGLRRVVDHSTVDRVYAILKDKNVAIDNQTWNRRYREYSQKIKTGSVLEIASVIRDLTVLKVEKELSFNERRMLDTAQGLLVKELSIAKASTEDLIKEELEQICQF